MALSAVKLEELVKSGIEDADVQISDIRGDGAYFNVRVMSARFSGLSVLEQHRLVMTSLKVLSDEHLHALQLSTITKEGV